MPQHRQQGCATARRQRGWSLSECLVGLSVSTLLVTQAVPGYQWMLARNRLAVTTNQLVLALHEARQLAISSNVAVSFCAGNADEGCSGDWSAQQWIVFVDRNRNGQLDDGEVLKHAETMEPTASIRIVGNGPFRKAIVYRPDGLARTATGAFAAGRLRVCALRDFDGNTNDLVLIGSGRVEPENKHYTAPCPAP